MDDLLNPVFLSRLQFALKALFHIPWLLLGIGLSLYLVIVEALWLKSGNQIYRRQLRFWTRLFLLNFAVGVISGFPLVFEFGTNWGRFSGGSGAFIGELFGFEASMAFMLEAGFLSIMAFGLGRVSNKLHFFSTCMVALGTTLSAFWIMVANSWMQSPTGGILDDGLYVMTDRAAAIFNPASLLVFSHMYVAALETTLFVIGGVSAFYLLRRTHSTVFIKSFRFG